MRFEVFSEKPFEIVLYSRFLGCNPAKKFSYRDIKWALMQPKIRKPSNISFNISFLGYY